MTMVERVARALFERVVEQEAYVGPHTKWDAQSEVQRDFWRMNARAAIEAMEPTLPMLVAGSAAMIGPLTSSSSVWQAMVQAALEGEG